jgi:maltose operon protein
MKTSWVVLLTAIGLVGCSSTEQLDNSLRTLKQTEVCCESLVKFPWIKLETNDKFQSTLDGSSPVWNFGHDKSYFSSFKFNERSGNVELIVRSIMRQDKVLKPSIILLNEDFKVVRTVANKDFVVKFSDALNKNRYELQLSLNAKQTPYFIVFGESEDIGQKVVVPHPAKLRAEQMGEPLPIVSDPSYVVSANGLIEVEVKTTSVSGTVQTNEVINAESKNSKLDILPDTQAYYLSSIKKSVEAGDIPKALSLLDEAKALGIEDAQEVFVKAVNAK